jgi:hypothetical protein
MGVLAVIKWEHQIGTDLQKMVVTTTTGNKSHLLTSGTVIVTANCDIDYGFGIQVMMAGRFQGEF